MLTLELACPIFGCVITSDLADLPLKRPLDIDRAPNEGSPVSAVPSELYTCNVKSWKLRVGEIPGESLRGHIHRLSATRSFAISSKS
jgi:hypothetical protein